MAKPDESHKQAYRQRMLLKRIWDQPNAVVLYQSRRAPVLCLLTIFVFLTFVISTCFSLTMPLDEYSSLFSARVWQFLFIMLPGLLVAANIWLSGRYVLKLEVLPDKMIRVMIWSVLCRKKIIIWRVDDFEPKGVFYEGRTEIFGKLKVHAPFLLYRLQNGVNLVLDLQGEMPHGPLIVMQLFAK